MHELSVAVSLIEIACEEAARAGATSVAAVHLRIGALSGIACDALRFSFEIAADGTMLQSARLEIEEIPVVIYCERCRDQKRLTDLFSLCCPSCGTPAPDVRSGRELELRAIEIDERSSAEQP